MFVYRIIHKIIYNPEEAMGSRREETYHKIQRAITNGTLSPGERLVEKRICEEFKVGRTPLREALSQLQIEGYLDVIPHKGFTVAKMSLENVKEIYDSIAALEGYATKMATQYLNGLDLKKLTSIHDNLRMASELNDSQKWLDENIRFHEYLVKASRNNFLHTLIDSVRNRIYRYRLISIAIANPFSSYFSAHEEILTAISNKNPDEAGKAMENHVLDVGKKVVDFMKVVPGF